MKNFFAVVLALLANCNFVAHAGTPPWPEGMSFVGLKNGAWQLYVVPEGATEPQPVPTVSEPRTPAFHAASGRVAYVAADGSVRERVLEAKNDTAVLKPSAKHAYTQPAYGPNGDLLYVVELKEGISVDTDIVALDRSRKAPKPVVTQPLAQFEPTPAGSHDLFYSSVLCTIGCGKIIQELWRMNVVSGEAQQLTLVNSIARQPSVSADGKWLYFSSNKAGHYHVWRMSLDDGRYEQLTSGEVTDISPGIDASGNVYFIRRSPRQTQLLRLDGSGATTPMPLPSGITDVRDLEMGL